MPTPEEARRLWESYQAGGSGVLPPGAINAYAATKTQGFPTTDMVGSWISNLGLGGALANAAGATGTRLPLLMRGGGATNTLPRTPATTSPAWANRHAYFYNPPAPGSYTLPERPEDPYAALLQQLLGGMGGGDGDPLGWAQLEQRKAEFAQQLALQQAQMAQQAELERMAREQRQREMAAQLGTALNQLVSSNWQQGMPYTLPKGTQYAPGFEPGGAVANLAKMGNAQYTPQRMAVANPPSRAELQQWLDDALSRFGPR